MSTALEITEMALVMEGEGVEVRRAPAGDSMTLVWVTCPKGFDFGPALKGLPHDMCCCEHWGMITKGRMEIVTHDGKSVSLGAGQAFHLLPGHMPSFPEDCAWYEFSPTEQVERLFSHMGLG
ncbi:MAG: hypothetical protein JSW46_06490 [Gemmatimonadota bacterium]|nr:MAG: hypothetical protein JSW46_06490 [Gemmatimonadota bacterium]